MHQDNYNSLKDSSMQEKELLAFQTLRDISKITNKQTDEEQGSEIEQQQIIEPSVRDDPNTTDNDVILPARETDELLDVAKTLEELRTESPILARKRSSTELYTPLVITEEQSSEFAKTKPKKRRRKRDEIERSFKCPVNGCTKSYGSEGALKTHVKLKHAGDPTHPSSPNVYAKVRTNDFSWQKVLSYRNEPKLINGTPSSIASLPSSFASLRTSSPIPTTSMQQTSSATSSPISSFSPISILNSPNGSSGLKLQLPPPSTFSPSSPLESRSAVLPPLMEKESTTLFYNFVKESGVTRI
jgi:hypothetical protein